MSGGDGLSEPLAVLDSTFRYPLGAGEDQVRGAWLACHRATDRRRRRPGEPVPAPPVQVLDLPNGPGLLSATADLNRTAVDGFDGIALHAGVVADGERAVVLPGASGHGKTTAVAAAVLAGLDYVSDEALCLRPDGTVVPYPKPLSLLPSSRRLLGLELPEVPDDVEAAVAPTALGAVTGLDGLTVRHIVLLQRGADDDVQVERLHQQDAFAALIPRCFHHYRRPEQTFDTLGSCARGAAVWRLRSGSPQRTAAALAHLVTSER